MGKQQNMGEKNKTNTELLLDREYALFGMDPETVALSTACTKTIQAILCQSLLGGLFSPVGFFLRGIFIQDKSTKIFLHVFE